MAKEYIEYKGETYAQALEVLDRHAITKLVAPDGVQYVASMIAMFESVEHMQAERLEELEAALKAIQRIYHAAFHGDMSDELWFKYYQPISNIVQTVLHQPVTDKATKIFDTEYGKIELDERILNVADDEWRRVLYDLKTEQEIAEHIAYNLVENRCEVWELDGWADMPHDITARMVK